VIREGEVFLLKHCPDCGDNEVLVSSKAEVWQKKREIFEYDTAEENGCALNCPDCAHDHHQTAAFLDVTSRCNLNCPICIANIPGMAVEYDPPLEYFQKVIDQLAEWNPKPRVNLFGGEPTVRKDVFEIIKMIRRHKMGVSLVTNGLALANEEYAKKVFASRAEILFAFDGRDPVIYEKMRGSSRSYETKLKAIENIRKFSRKRHTWVCTLSLGLNDQHVPDYFKFVHEHRANVRRIFFIPLTEMWDAGLYETDSKMTTPEEVEGVIQQAFPGEPVEFVPAGVFERVLPAARFFGTTSIHFAGAHPNCESVAHLVSDGERFRPVGYYMKKPVTEVLVEVLQRAKTLNPKLEKLDPAKWFQRQWGKLLIYSALGGIVWRAADLKKIFKGSPVLGLLGMAGGLLLGGNVHKLRRKYMAAGEFVAVVLLPFEEWDSVETGRMRRCTSVFVYLDPDTDKVQRVPFCMWCHYRKEMFTKIGVKYPPMRATAAEKNA
jgi:hypothetical protein